MSSSDATDWNRAARVLDETPWRPAKYLLWVAAVQATGIVSTLALPWTTPFAFADCLVYVGVAMLPAAGLLLYFMHEDSPQWPYRREGVAPARLNARRFGVVMTIAFLPGFSLLIANQALDRSAGVMESGVVLGKQIRAGRSGRIYEVAFATAHHGPLGQYALKTLFPIPDWTRGGQPVRVNAADFDRVRPGTHLTLRVHRGVFGLPWYERDSIILTAPPAKR